jgi:hypothetical protein
MAMPEQYSFLGKFELPNSWLGAVIKVQIEEVLKFSADWPDSGCLVADIGEILTRATAGLS